MDDGWKRSKCPECGSVRMALYEMEAWGAGDAVPFQVRCAKCNRLIMEMGI